MPLGHFTDLGPLGLCQYNGLGVYCARGEGVLSLEKGTNCGPTAAELWLSRTKIAKKEGLSRHYECALGAVKLVYIRILH